MYLDDKIKQAVQEMKQAIQAIQPVIDAKLIKTVLRKASVYDLIQLGLELAKIMGRIESLENVVGANFSNERRQLSTAIDLITNESKLRDFQTIPQKNIKKNLKKKH